MADDWRVCIAFSGGSVRSVRQALITVLGSRLGGQVAVSSNATQIFVYAPSIGLADEAAQVAREVLAQRNISVGTVRTEGWSWREQEWRDADEMPADPAPDRQEQERARHAHWQEQERASSASTGYPAEPLCRIDTDGRSVFSVSWHPNGRSIAIAAKGGYTRVYDIPGKRPEEYVAVKGAPSFSWVLDVAFSPDGTRLATGSSDGSAGVWDAASGQQLLEIRHRRSVTAVAFSPDGTRLATGREAGRAGSARVWDAASGQQLLEIRHSRSVTAVAFSPDGTRLATGSEAGSAQVWDAASGQQLLEVRHDWLVTAVAFSPDGTRLATGSWDKSARVWDAASGQQLLEVRHDKEVAAVAFSPDGTRLATGSSDKTVRVWSVAEL